ncbi:PleD family two-component system response regulator [Terricaulis sp.]|uniref:PleD family two-component system response regulator n=1 Tax=Terricaulis sp. TaxID=2768686 RepID=UPI003784C7D4
MARGGDETVLKILVVDDQPFQRRLVTETLRSLGRVTIEYVENAEQCMLAFLYFEPDMVVLDWALNGGQGLDLVKRLRAGEAGEQFKKAPIIMVAERTSTGQLERARAAGVDEFVLRPFSTATLLKRVKEVRDRRRDFVESTKYAGPCRRRRKRDDGYDGPRRRLFDVAEKGADAPDVQIRKGLARMYVERLHQLVKEANSPAGVRDLCLTCGQLSTLASDMKDKLLMSATSSLFSYIKGVGAEAPMNLDVVKAHLDAILQLAELPNSQFEIRQTVTQQLGVMVTKKLRQAGQAA